MRSLARYALGALAVLAVAVTGLWPLLDASGRAGLLWAAVAAYPVQLAAFGLMQWGRRHPERFLAAWGVGILARFGVLGVMALAVGRLDGVGTAALVLGLAGFLFVLAMMEPLFLTADVVPGKRD
ncbi:MAG: hypothetical protein ACLFWG_07365 [Longimicrobiales bacterium]